MTLTKARELVRQYEDAMEEFVKEHRYMNETPKLAEQRWMRACPDGVFMDYNLAKEKIARSRTKGDGDIVRSLLKKHAPKKAA